jgi:hypothetical protein
LFFYFIRNVSGLPQQQPALAIVQGIGSSGEITAITISSNGRYFNNNPLDIQTFFQSSGTQQATISFTPDSFCIADINIVSSGDGYMFWDQVGNQQPIPRKVIVSGAGDGYGFSSDATQEEQIVIDWDTFTSLPLRKDRNRSPYQDQYGNTVQDSDINFSYNIESVTIPPPVSHAPITGTILSHGIQSIYGD